MDKKEWIKVVAQRLEEPEELVAPILEAGLEEIYQAMKREEKVTLVNFGTFYISVRRSGTVFKFNPSQKWKALFGWSSTYKGDL
ncbi:MAG: HU family DNA-binding protein [Ardenticatenaceae bacterium]|nr:HU family DNA-binding protein [Ardenticatenaceae bacterium]MCB9443422.1 HU family DNA-binding protein [Ardenticatenaceae bacterium]